MSFAIGLGGIVVALVFLTFAVYKGWSILYSSIIGVIIIALTNGMNLYNALTVDYVSSFTSYAANYFILFCEGACWASCTTSAARPGNRQDRGGQVRHQVCPDRLHRRGRRPGVRRHLHLRHLLRPAALAKPIFRETGTPWYMWPAITIVPIIGPELMTPGGLQSHNMIPTEILNTDLLAAPLMARCSPRLLCPLRPVSRLGAQAVQKGGVEAQLPAPDGRGRRLPEPRKGPPHAPRGHPDPCRHPAHQLRQAAAHLRPGYQRAPLRHPVLPQHPRRQAGARLNDGFANGVMPLMLVTAVVGMAQVISQTDSFTVIRDAMLNFSSTSKVATAFSVVGITNVMALISGSASGASP